jgi:hypothetical protein
VVILLQPRERPAADREADVLPTLGGDLRQLRAQLADPRADRVDVDPPRIRAPHPEQGTAAEDDRVESPPRSPAS